MLFTPQIYVLFAGKLYRFAFRRALGRDRVKTAVCLSTDCPRRPGTVRRGDTTRDLLSVTLRQRVVST